MSRWHKRARCRRYARRMRREYLLDCCEEMAGAIYLGASFTTRPAPAPDPWPLTGRDSCSAWGRSWKRGAGGRR